MINNVRFEKRTKPFSVKNANELAWPERKTSGLIWYRSHIKFPMILRFVALPYSMFFADRIAKTWNRYYPIATLYLPVSAIYPVGSVALILL